MRQKKAKVSLLMIADKYKTALFIVFISLVFLFLGMLKSGFYVDEIYSFAHSNSSVGAFLEKEIVPINGRSDSANLVHKWIKGEVFYHWLSGDDTTRFGYEHIKDNMIKDVHPLLYFWLLHSVEMISGGGISKWGGLALNFVLLCLLFYCFYKLAEIIFENKEKAFVVLMFFAVTPLVLQMQMFIRMYLLMMALMCGVLWQTAAFIKSGLKKYLWGVFGFSLLCFLTHYYALIMIFFLTATVCLYFFIAKKYRSAFVFGATVLGALLIMSLIFSGCWQVLFFSDRGVESREGFDVLSWQLFLDVAIFFFAEMGNAVCGIYGFGVVLLLATIMMLGFGRFNKIVLIFGISACLSGVMIALVAPNMGNFNGRYYAGVFVPMFLVLATAIEYIFSKYLSKTVLICGWLIFAFFEIYMMTSSSYLNRQSQIRELVDVVRGKSVILQINFYLSIFLPAEAWQEAKRIYVIGPYEHPYEILNEVEPGTILVHDVGEGRVKFKSHAFYANDRRLHLDYRGMMVIDKVLYDVYEKNDISSDEELKISE